MNLANLTKFSLSNLATALVVAAATGSTVMGATKIVKTVAQNQNNKIPTLTTAPSPSPSPSPSNTPTPTPNPNSNKCIITVDGQQYDVTTLRTTHSGGDVFQCGTDMSAIFHSQHGYDLNRLAPYKLTSSTSNSTPSPNTSPMPTASPIPQQTRYDDDLDKLTENEPQEHSEQPHSEQKTQEVKEPEYQKTKESHQSENEHNQESHQNEAAEIED